MKPSSHCLFRAAALTLGALAFALHAVAAGPTKAPAAPPPPPEPVPRSEFNSDPSVGRDPFFPNSARWRPPKIASAAPTVVRSEFPEDLVLKGISGSSAKRLAILNHYTLAAGEEADIKSGNQTYRVLCVEVKERSVVVTIRGITRELELRKGI